MTRLKLKELREKSNEELLADLAQLRSELAKLRLESAKGTLRKDSGKLWHYRRDIARILTILRERGKKL